MYIISMIKALYARETSEKASVGLRSCHCTKTYIKHILKCTAKVQLSWIMKDFSTLSIEILHIMHFVKKVIFYCAALSQWPVHQADFVAEAFASGAALC